MPTKTNKVQLYKAHKDIEVIMESNEKSRLSKSLEALRVRFNLLEKSSTVMAGNDGYPNDQGAETRISRARGKSKPAKHPDGNYEGLEEGENDTTTYENFEDDALDGSSGKAVTSKSFTATSEDDFYKSVIDSDEDGEVVAAINATDALEHLTTVMGKSIAAVSKQYEGLGTYTTTQFVEMNKSMAVLAEAIGTIMETLEKSASAWMTPVEEDTEAPKVEGTEETLAAPAAEVAAEAVVDKSQGSEPLSEDQKKYQNTLDWLQKSSPTNIPSYFSTLNGQAGMDKAQVERNTPEELNTLGGKKRVRQAVTALVKSGGLNPDYLGMTDYRAPSDVVASVPVQFRDELRKLLA